MNNIDELKAISKIDKLSEKQSVMALRLAIKAEIDAVHLYELIAEATENEIVRDEMLHLVEEEKMHIGELFRAIKELSIEEFETYEKGAREFEEEVLKMKPEEYDFDDEEEVEQYEPVSVDLDSIDYSFESMLDGVDYKGRKK